MKHVIAIVLGLPLVAGIAAADPTATIMATAPERSVSINLDPAGVIQGYYGGNAGGCTARTVSSSRATTSARAMMRARSPGSAGVSAIAGTGAAA